MAEEVLTSRQSGVLEIIINRPASRNALDPTVLRMLSDSFRSAAADRSVRVITLSGAGDKVFCAGADLKSALGEEDRGGAFLARDYHELLLGILQSPKPTVALARGHVMAGGLGLVLACDLALACDDIHFSTPEILVGMFPMMVLALLYRHVGRKQATEMLYLGERIPATAAAQMGIVNHVCPRARFEFEAGELAKKLTERSPAIIRLGKEAMRRVEDLELPVFLDYLEDALGKVMSSADSKEGIRAFLEKRKPRWADLPNGE